jgi:uncharacterized membrane protein YdjX (TVP38/TMEM64 family)
MRGMKRKFTDRCRTFTASALTGSARRTSTRHARPLWKKAVLPLLVMLALFLVWRYTPLADVLTARNIVKWSREVGATKASAVLMVLAFVVSAFVMFPRPILTLLSVIAYGPLPGFSVSMLGILASATAVYYAGRAVPREKLDELGGPKLKRAAATLRRHGVLAALALSIVPVAPFPLIGMTAGAARVKLWQYLTGVMLGMLPGTVATALFTDQLLAALDEEADVNYWIVAAAVLVLAAVIFFVRRWLIKIHK